MIRFALSPPLPLHDDENGQGYFARLGYFHAGVSAGKFCRYSNVDRFDFRSGRAPFIEAVAALSGVGLEQIEANTLRQDGADVFHLRRQKLGLPVVRRTFARFCPDCLRADADGFSGIAEGASRLRWAWLLRPVVACPVHNVRLTELAAPDSVTSVTPIADDQIGQTQGQFNRDDLEAFKEEVFRDTRHDSAESKDFVSLTAAIAGKSSTAEILQWQLGGQLRGTRLLNGVRRLDHLRFDRHAILSLAKDRRGPDLNRVTLVARILGISPKSVKKLLQAKRGGPRLSPAPASAIADLNGTVYVATAEIERFLGEYITLSLVARQVGRHFTSVRRELKMAGIMPVIDASSLGARIYRRGDVAAFLALQGTPTSMPLNDVKYEPIAAVFGNKTMISGENSNFGESDDVIL